MSHPKKHARTYMNRFTINEDDQFEISKIEEMDSDWEFKEGPRPQNVHSRIHQLVKVGESWCSQSSIIIKN